MKNRIVLATLILLLAACNTVERQKEKIRVVSADFSMAQENLRGLLQRLTGELEMLNVYQSRLNPASVADTNNLQFVPLSKEAAELEMKLSGHNAKIATILQEIGKSSEKFSAYQQTLEAMNASLAQKTEYEGDVRKTLRSIEQNVAEIQSKLKNWETQIDELSKNVKKDYEEGAQKLGISNN